VTVFERDGAAQATKIKWKGVKGIVAYKRDLLTLDLICLGLTTDDGVVEIDEEMSGWTALIDALPVYLSGALIPSDWRDKVVRPPFAANPVVLFSR
jgi:hypothetical protein